MIVVFSPSRNVAGGRGKKCSANGLSRNTRLINGYIAFRLAAHPPVSCRSFSTKLSFDCR
jgi:hypothetical protein